MFSHVLSRIPLCNISSLDENLLALSCLYQKFYDKNVKSLRSYGYWLCVWVHLSMFPLRYILRCASSAMCEILFIQQQKVKVQPTESGVLLLYLLFCLPEMRIVSLTLRIFSTARQNQQKINMIIIHYLRSQSI